MIALPIAAEPKVMRKEASSSVSAMPGELSAKISSRRCPRVEPEQATDEQRGGAGADREVDGEQAEQRDAEERVRWPARTLIVGHG